MAKRISVTVHYISSAGAPSTVLINAFNTDDHEDVKALAMIAVEELDGHYVRFETEATLYKNTLH